MRRADRLFQIIQILRRNRRPLTAEAIAAELETSKRTVYRDIADLIGRRGSPAAIAQDRRHPPACRKAAGR